MKTFLKTAALITALAVSPALAKDVTQAQNAQMQAAVTQFEKNFFEGNMQAVADGIPPKVLTLIAKNAGIEVSDLKKVVIEQMTTAMTQVTFEHYTMEEENAVWSETSAGRPYALIPTSMRIRMSETQAMESNTQTLAFEDEGRWYLVRVDETQQVLMLGEAYPDFKGIEFPQAATKMVE